MVEKDNNPDQAAEEAPKKKSKLPLIVGLVLALIGGGGGFFGVRSGMLFSDESHAAQTHDAAPVSSMPDIAYVAVEPIVVSLGKGANSQHLRFRSQLEVQSQYKTDVETLLPRVVDVLNNYLRALQASDIEDASALVRLRAQMLRRVQIVTGAGRVNDLLIMEFVLN